MKATINRNEKYNGIEITFNQKPEEAIREELKANGFRWHGKRKLWYAKETAANLALAQRIAGNEEIAPAKAKEPERNHDVKIGDLFVSQWGYEANIVDYYQVVGLKGKTQVVIRALKKNVVGSGNGWQSYKVVPAKGEWDERTYKEVELVKKVQGTPGHYYLTMNSYANAYWIEWEHAEAEEYNYH